MIVYRCFNKHWFKYYRMALRAVVEMCV